MPRPVLAACSKDKTDEPAVLVPMVNRIEVKSVWPTNEGRRKADAAIGPGAAVDGDRVFVASHKGAVDAFDLASGKAALAATS